MKKYLSVCLALTFSLAVAAAADATSPRLPEPLIIHARATSLAQFAKDLDSFMTASIKGTPAADLVPAGAMSMALAMACPLPQSAWKSDEEAHFLALVSPEGKMEIGFVVSGYDLEHVSTALQDKRESWQGDDKQYLVARLKNSRQRACFQVLAEGRLLITETVETGERFRGILETWEPRMDSGAAVSCRIDLATVQSIFKPKIAEGFATIRREMTKASAGTAKLRENILEPDELADFDVYEKLLNGSLNAFVGLIDSMEAEFPSLEEVRLDIDCRDGVLLATTSLAATSDSAVGEIIAGYADTANPDFPFIGAFPKDSVFYTYQAAAPEKTAARLHVFFKRMFEQVLAEADPKTAADVVGLLEDFVKAGPGATSTGVYMSESDEMVFATYSAWERPDDVIPLIRRISGLLTDLHGRGMALAEKYIRKSMEKRKDAKKSETDEEFEKKLLDGGMQRLMEPVFQSDDGERYGVPYASLAIAFNFEQLLPALTGREALKAGVILDQLRAVEDNLKFFWAQAGKTIIFSHGALDLDNIDPYLEELLTGAAGKHDSSLEDLVKEKAEWLATVAPDRQAGFSLCRPSRSSAMLLVNYVDRIGLGGDSDTRELAWNVFHGVDDGDEFFYTWNGVADGRLRISMAMPAAGINEVVGNGYKLKDELTVLIARIVSAMQMQNRHSPVIPPKKRSVPAAPKTL